VSESQIPCQHCGTPFRPTSSEKEFCCQGCRYVHGLITGQGLDRFYELKDRALAPVGNTVFEPVDTEWLEKLIRTSEASRPDRNPEATLEIQGISCVGCAWLIQRLFEETPGALHIRVYPTRGTLDLCWKKEQFDAADLARRLRQFGYRLGPPGQETPSSSVLHDLTRRIGLCAAFALNAMLFTLPRYLGLSEETWLTPLLEIVTCFCATLSMVVGGSYFIRRTLAAFQLRVIHIDLPISLGLVLAYLGSLAAWLTGQSTLAYFDFVSIFTFLMLAGRWVQERSVIQNRTRYLKSQQEPEAVLSEDDEKSIPLEDIRPGTVFRLRPGAILPVTSRLNDRSAEFSLQWINGEPEPRCFQPGQSVRSGALLLGDLKMSFRAEEEWPQSLLHRLWSGDHRSASPLLRDRIIRIYLITILVIGFFGFAGWMFTTRDLPMAFQVLISVLVVSCPCAIGVALPLADEWAGKSAQRIGVFIRDQSFWARCGRLRKILYDKTGTLSLDVLKLTNPESLGSLTEDARAACAALVQHSRHPVAACLRTHLYSLGIQPAQGARVKEVPGKGLVYEDEKREWKLGRPGWASQDSTIEGTVLSENGRVCATFHTEEHIRPDAREECQRLINQGYSIHILSGDRQDRVSSLTEALGLDASAGIGNLTPEEKADAVRDLDEEDTLMIGDGANDSLAFDRAWCRGTPAIDTGLLEYKADFFFLGSNLEGVRKLLQIGQIRTRAIRSVLIFTVAYNAIALALCLMGLMNPLIAAILMPTSSVLSLSIVAGRRWNI
jgi:Cu2+-exporting ATPase